MSQFGKSQTLSRIEDIRFLTGQGRYVDDIAPEAALFAWFFRSPVAHARITAIDLDAARAAPGVHLVAAAQDLVADGVILTMEAHRVRNRDGSKGADPDRPVLAQGKVHFAGEAVAVIVAETLDQARDAGEMIGFEYDDLDANLDVEAEGPELHPAAAPGNLAYDWVLGDAEAAQAAFAAAAHHVTLRVEHNRVIANSMEPRGCYAEWQDGRLHLAVNGQGVWDQKAEIARVLGLPPEAVRVTNPDVGGGFGMKSFCYPEYTVCAYAARKLGRPVRWMSERIEAMLTDNAGRDLVSTAELAFDRDLKITAYRVNILSNLGAYNSEFAQAIQSDVSSKVLTGVYDIQTVFVNARGIYTNTAPVDAYRGAGRPEAIYTLERLMDGAARQLGVSGADLRRRNYIPADAMPYRTASGELYDTGDFARVLARVETEADIAGFPARRAQSAGRGLLRGLGLCSYIESILGDPSEGARIEFNADGTLTLFVGTQSNGQGHETVYAQFLSDRTGIPVSMIRIVQGDSDRIAQGGGTGGSRSVTVQSAATLATIEVMVQAFTPFLAAALDLPQAGFGFEDGAFRAPGSNRTVTLTEAADMARAAGRTDLLVHEARTRLPGRSYPNGTHVAEVEIDPETGALALVAYTVTDDFGNLMHPRLAEGQVHGGVAQGYGQAVRERAVFSPEGQLLTASFMDYAVPRAADLPMFRFTSEPVPSTANPLGMKGCGEAGTVGSLAAVTNAALDALWERGVRTVDMPLTPLRIWTWLEEARLGAS